MADTNNQNSFLDYAGLALFWNKIKKIIEDNELVTATALANLDTKLDDIEGLVTEASSIIETTYADLKSLKDNEQLIPGQQYRITDYETTTVQENTTTAGHLFDIVVTANSKNGFYEVARAVYNSDRDTYFENSNLDAWKIWYCFDNDSDRFLWADQEGTGVIYRMIDEFNNDCPYDFKNIMFLRYELNSPDPTDGDLNTTRIFTNIIEHFNHGMLSYIWDGITDNETAWDYDEMLYSSPTGNTKSFYTFSYTSNNGVLDESLFNNNCHSNVINAYRRDNKFILNNIVFLNTDTYSNCYSNTFGNDCYCNTFGFDCYCNTFGNDCYSNTFANICYCNSFGDNCYYNTLGSNIESNNFGYNCSYNSFANSCSTNSLSDNCYSNSLRSNCYHNRFGYNCTYNSLDTSCQSNSFSNNCNYNSFGIACNTNTFDNGCYSNSFGDSCYSNSFGNDCHTNSFGNDCRTNSFGNGCYYNSFGNDCYSNSFGNDCFFISFKITGDDDSSIINFCRYNAFDDGCSRIIVYSANTTSDAYLENYHINRGVKGAYSNPMLIDAQYLNSENVCNVYKKGDVAVVAYIQY